MKIIVDKEGAQALGGLMDLALKQGGMANLDAINKLRESIQAFPVASDNLPDENAALDAADDAEMRG